MIRAGERGFAARSQYVYSSTVVAEGTTSKPLRLPAVVRTDGEYPKWCRFRKLYTSVSMMQPTKDRIGDDISDSLDGTPVRRILAQRNMRSRLIVSSLRISRGFVADAQH
jgi:hypothetical protein